MKDTWVWVCRTCRSLQAGYSERDRVLQAATAHLLLRQGHRVLIGPVEELSLPPGLNRTQSRLKVGR